jgi:hypothetical protein
MNTFLVAMHPAPLAAAALVCILVSVAIFCVFHMIVYGHGCKKCNRKHALSKTGKTGLGKRSFGGSDCVITEFKCKYCGDLSWEKTADLGGPGGLGGF